jgi:hypothetical protein
MSPNMQVVLEGLPERVQETADTLDRAFPGLMTWRRFAIPGQDCSIRLEGEAVARNAVLPRPANLVDRAPALGKRWKVSPAVNGGANPRLNGASSLRDRHSLRRPGSGRVAPPLDGPVCLDGKRPPITVSKLLKS